MRSAPGCPTRSSAPAKPATSIRPMRDEDWPAVRDIYEAGIATGNATFETAAPTLGALGRQPPRRPPPRRPPTDDAVVGWAALSPVSDRCVYAGVAENSVYIHPDHRGRGVGTDLLDALVAGAERAGYLDGPDRDLPREHRQHRRPRARRVPHRRPPRAHRSARRSLARHAVPRTPQHPHLSAVHETTGWFTAHDGLRLFERSWSPTGEPRGAGRDPPRRRRALRPIRTRRRTPHRGRLPG